MCPGPTRLAPKLKVSWATFTNACFDMEAEAYKFLAESMAVEEAIAENAYVQGRKAVEEAAAV